jgi:translocation and assembly module TamA
MHKTQRILLTLLVCLYSTTLFAQVSVNVEIRGIDKRLEDNVRLFLSIEQQKDHALVSEGRLRRLHKKAPLEISQALQPFGYYRPLISSQLMQPAPGSWLAIYTIDSGPPLPVGKFNFVLSGSMNEDPAFHSLSATLPFNQGEVFDHLRYEEIKASLARLAAERGYFNARFIEHRIEIDLDSYEARIHLHYDSGLRYHFGEVLFDQDALEPELLRRYIPFESGSPYTLDHLINLQQALNDSDYFRSAEVSPGQPLLDSAEIPVSVMLTPRIRHRYSFGLGYGTDTGARTKFDWEIPLLNRRGHRISTEIKITEIGYSLSANYRVPVLNPRTDQMIYSAGVVNEKTDTHDSTVRTIGATLNRGRGRWRESLSLSYQQEEFVIAEESGRSTLLIPSINWSRTWGRNFIYILDGLRFDIGLRGANERLISDTNFFQLQGGIKAINPLGRHNRVIVRGRLGSTWTEAFQQLPSSVRFFAGGAQSVRGYAYDSLGPVNNSGEVIGGKHLMIGSIEFEHRLNDKWGAAVFYDGGNAIDKIADKLERGAGLGLRWQSPVGPVRIDLATAVSRDDRPWRLHINIGPDL